MPPIPPFPLYLLPSIPFRRRRSSATTTSTISPSSSPSSSPPQPTSFLTTRPVSHLQCSKCLSHLLPTSSIISKGFTGRYGRAYLCGPVPQPPNSLASTFGDACAPGDLPNTLTGKPMPRQLVTGAHTVSDITCKICGTVLGWKYVEAKEETQKYKVGKYILETKRVVRSPGWDSDQDIEAEIREHDEVVDDIEFDSQDEDECEDLFMGVWSKELAGRRRKNKTFST